MTIFNYLGRAVWIGEVIQVPSPVWVAKAAEWGCVLEWVGEPEKIQFGCNLRIFPPACNGVMLIVSPECKRKLKGRSDVFTVGDQLIPGNPLITISEVISNTQ
jgi:hypothetical protein